MSDKIALALDSLVPRFEGERGDWERVLRDAGPRSPRTRVVTRRRLVLLAAALAAALIPLGAIGASQDWWFLHDAAPQAVSAVVVVKEGVWAGKPWQLVAYRSTTDGLCVGLTPKSADVLQQAGTLDCAPFEGVPATAETKHTTPLGITYIDSGGVSGGIEFPPSIVGAVVGNATEVVLTFGDESVVRAQAFLAPTSLGAAVRFYAVEISDRLSSQELVKAAGLDEQGRVVACIISPLPEDGVPLSACA